MRTPILTITNHHIPSCGTPLQLSEAGRRISYYQNQHGEQWFFISDDVTQTGLLTGGDVDWTEHAITWDKPLPKINLDPAETAWLYSCILALFKKMQPEIQKRIADAGQEHHSDSQ